MNFGQHFRKSVLVAASIFSLLPTELAGECVIARPPLRVHQICGQVQMQGHSLPGTLRLTKRDPNDRTKPFERIEKTDDEGQFVFKDVPAGQYEMRLTPIGMTEVFLPTLVDLRRPRRKDACVKPIDLKLNFLPEPCVSPELRKKPK